MQPKAWMSPKAKMLQRAARPRAKANALARRWTPLKRPVKKARERWTQFLKKVQMVMVLEVELQALARRAHRNRCVNGSIWNNKHWAYSDNSHDFGYKLDTEDSNSGIVFNRCSSW